MDEGRRAFEPDEYAGDLQREAGETPVDGATWYTASSQGEALVYDVAPGALAGGAYLATDFLLDGPDTAMFRLALTDGEATFTLLYGVIPECEGRVRLPLDALDQHRSDLEREGAWCKPMIRGDRVDPADVERVELALVSDPGDGVRWSQSPLTVTAEEPPRLTDPALPEGPLLDEFGQATFREWDGHTESEAELVERLRAQRDAADGSVDTAGSNDPDRFDDWGGRTDHEFTATGFFRTHYSGGRWWLVTPDGHPFWSAGLDVVSPNVTTRYDGIEDALTWLPDEDGRFADAFEHWAESGEYVDYLVANLIRAFGADDWREAWAEIAFSQLRELGFNTVGNWSDWEAASEAGVPYTRPLELAFPETPMVFRDFPDVYHDAFPGDAAAVAADLEATADDPAMVGYFLGNEPDWRAGNEPVAVAMLRTGASSACRRELADWLADRYGLGDPVGGDGGTGDGETGDSDDDDSLADVWNMDVTLDDVREGVWDRELTAAARADLEQFSSRMVDRLYGVLGAACREVDPDHLNLGNRLVDVPADWVLDGMAGNVDVLTCNCYRHRLPAEYATVSERVGAPILVGEFHFGAPDVGLPFPSLQPVASQAARGGAYRYYVEHAAAQPWCVGTHYFTMYDESALGRFDGENMNIGFFDICHRPYEPLADAAREAHDRLYALARSEVDPYDDAPAYLTSR